jgi:hypothetical protein
MNLNREHTGGSHLAVAARASVLLLPTLLLGLVGTAGAHANPGGAAVSPATVVPAQHPDIQYLGRWGITGMSVSVRVEDTADSGRLSFQIDDVGWTDIRDG